MDIHFIASLEENCLDKIQLIARNLEEKGCKIRHILQFSGIIAGSIDEKIPLEQLKIAGIRHIEKDRDVRATDRD